MDNVKTGKAVRVLGALAGVLLLLLWLASMPMDDDRLCATAPLGFGWAAVLGLAVLAMVAGARPARPTLVFLFGLGGGVYFLCRCLATDMLSEIWRELPLLLAAFVFYGAGFSLAQRRGGVALMVALAVGVLVNVVYFFVMLTPDIPLEVAGRPTMSLAGENYKGLGRTLFTYCNFSTLFLMAAGGVLVCRPIWVGWRGWGSFFAALVGMLGIVISCLCTGRSVMGLAPLLLVAAWVFWAIIRLYSGKGLGVGVILSGFVLLAGVLVGLGELFLGDSLLRSLLSVDNTSRATMWTQLYGLLPDVPWYGHGAGATQWQMAPTIEGYASMPNYAHNDYLQAWMDYGVVGVGLLVALLLVHFSAGFWALASEDIDRERRALVAACMLLLLSLAACAVFEFVWHNVALVGLSAFACGVLAAPVPNRGESLFKRRRWAAGSRPSLRPVRCLGLPGAALACIGCVALALGCCAFAWRLLPAWKAQWEYNALYHAGASDAQRVLFLEHVMEFYPDPELVDHYVTLSPPAGRKDNLRHMEHMLRLALESNPHQIYTVTMLADLLSHWGRYEETEVLLREKYVNGGQPQTALANWPAYYGMNLLRWGHQKMREGDQSTALSMMEYALNLWGHSGGFDIHRHSPERRKAEKAYIAARRVDVDLLHTFGVERDDTWKQPLRPGGAAALYENWGNEASTRRYADPYGRRTLLER